MATMLCYWHMTGRRNEPAEKHCCVFDMNQQTARVL